MGFIQPFREKRAGPLSYRGSALIICNGKQLSLLVVSYIIYPFTAPTVIPLMKYFCKLRNRIAMGTTERMIAAMAVV